MKKNTYYVMSKGVIEMVIDDPEWRWKPSITLLISLGGVPDETTGHCGYDEMRVLDRIGYLHVMRLPVEIVPEWIVSTPADMYFEIEADVLISIDPRIEAAIDLLESPMVEAIRNNDIAAISRLALDNNQELFTRVVNMQWEKEHNPIYMGYTNISVNKNVITLNALKYTTHQDAIDVLLHLGICSTEVILQYISSFFGVTESAMMIMDISRGHEHCQIIRAHLLRQLVFILPNSFEVIRMLLKEEDVETLLDYVPNRDLDGIWADPYGVADSMTIIEACIYELTWAGDDRTRIFFDLLDEAGIGHLYSFVDKGLLKQSKESDLMKYILESQKTLS